MKTRLTLFLAFSFLTLNCSSQSIEKWIAANEKVPVEKIYIQTDGENYFHNDTIWMKIYLSDSKSGQLIPGAENVYVNLIDEFGKQVIKAIFLSVNGQASGYMAIPDTIKPGNFVLQAFTNYLLNFNESSNFYKSITISRISGFSRSVSVSDRTENMVADVSFLPEGGILLEGVTNVVAFKAISREGFGVNAKGTVRDEKGITITTFSTDYKGMGLFFLTPEHGKSYYAQITGFPSYRYEFKPVKDAVKIQLVNHTTKEVLLNIAGNAESTVGKTFYLANLHRGEVLFYQEFVMDGMNKVLKFENSSLKDGINRMVLLDENFEPVSERLIFERPERINNLVVETNSNSFKNRDEIKLRISDEKYLDPQDFSNLSVVVVHEEAVPESGWNKNIRSHLLIDSELNGFVESSADLLVDNDLSSEAKLRLVMLTNGWSSYFWNGVPAKTDTLEYKQIGGLTLVGVASNPLTGNPIQNGEITLVIHKNSEMGFLTQKTDINGQFRFPGLLFSDTAMVYVQAKSETGKMNTDITIEPLFKSNVAGESQVAVLKEDVNISGKLAEMKYESFTKNRKYLLANNLNKPVRKKQELNTSGSDGHFRLYDKADFVLEVDENERSFDNVIDYMVGKIPGVDVNGNEIRIRGASSFASSSTPLFLVDGVPLSTAQNIGLPEEVVGDEYYESDLARSEERMVQSVKLIPLNDVEKIEVLKSPTNLAIFGVKGANGVIAIYTRHGKELKGEKDVRGIIEKKVVGYAGYKTFYSPKYTPENDDSEKPDFRTTLYWNPEVKTIMGSAELSFFSSDYTGTYHIFVEGITSDGKICIGKGDFDVIPEK